MYRLPIEVSSLDWVRDPFMLSVFESADCCRRRWADGNKKRRKTETEAPINRVVSPTGVAHHHKEGEWSTPSFLYIASVWCWLLCYEHDEEQEQVAASNTAGGLEGMRVNHPSSNKRHHETSSSTGFPLIFLCLHKDFLFPLTYIFKKISYPLYTYCK
jgi:hypothetical protein